MNVKKKIDKVEYVNKTLINLQNTPSIISQEIINQIDSLNDEQDSFEIKKTFQLFEKQTKEAFEKWISDKVSIVVSFENDEKSNKEKYLSDISYKNGEEFKKKSKYFDDLNTKLSDENKKLNLVLLLEKEKDLKQKQQDSLLNQIIETHISIIEKGEKLCSKLSCKADELEVKATFVLKEKELSQFYETRFNSRSSQNIGIEKFIEQYKQPTRKTFIKEFLVSLLTNKYTLKSGNLIQNVASDFLSQCWFSVNYDVIYQNDNFKRMSPGKQAFVVLKMLLDFSSKKCPILIDQPEDSLDNRAIYHELVSYIKEKKTKRQIILVTHNANIVVGADAELVIVANQNGKDAPNKNGIKFQYVTGALENSINRDDSDVNKPILERQGIREHICEILEGGKDAFDIREKKYGFGQRG
jgi:hypothetical protein